MSKETELQLRQQNERQEDGFRSIERALRLQPDTTEEEEDQRTIQDIVLHTHRVMAWIEKAPHLRGCQMLYELNGCSCDCGRDELLGEAAKP